MPYESTNDTTSVHISSLVIHCLPDKLQTIMENTATIANVEVAAHDISGKIIALLETETETEILNIIDHVNTLKGVLTTTMVYHELDC